MKINSIKYKTNKNKNLSNNKILITGGASGIGLGLTERFLEENNTVIICGRRESVLNEVKETILSLEEDVDVNQINFFNKVKEKLEHFVV